MISLLIVLTVASWLFWLTAWLCTYEFFSAPQQVAEQFTPPVSLLKPIKGMEPDLYERLMTFVHQDYPEYEVLFGVLDADDSAMNVLSRLQREHPDRVRVCVVDPVGLNNKVSILHGLATEARYSVMALSDSDMHVTPDYLRRVVSPLADPDVGLVTCPYIGEKPLTLTARLEALYMGATFLPLVMVARRYLKMRFSMGSTAVFRATELEAIGGFKALADYLADDYELAHQISALGVRVHLSDYVVHSMLGHTTFAEQWHREVRWQRCTRVSRPVEYPALLVTMSLPLALAVAISTGFSTLPAIVLGASLVLRLWVAREVTSYTADLASRRWLTLLPVRDLLTLAIWVAGGFGRSVRWRGERYSLTGDGKLAPASGRGLRQRLRTLR